MFFAHDTVGMGIGKLEETKQRSFEESVTVLDISEHVYRSWFVSIALWCSRHECHRSVIPGVDTGQPSNTAGESVTDDDEFTHCSPPP
jgi:hypothetical protein